MRGDDSRVHCRIEIDDGEEAVLGAMAETLRIQPADADRIASVLMIKYAT